MEREERFPRLVHSIGELDRPVYEQLMAGRSNPAQIKLILVLPPMDQWLEWRNWRRWLHRYRVELTPERTVVLTDTDLLIASRPKGGNQVYCTTIPLSAILAFDLGAVLLRGWMQISWGVPDGYRQIQLDFSTVGFRLMRRLLTALQMAVLAFSPMSREKPSSPCGQVERLPLKFLNILRLDALLPNEAPLALVFEPPVPPRWIFGRGGREGKLWAVTSDHCLLIREPTELYPYGEVTTFCPRHLVGAVEVEEVEQGVELRLSLSEGSYFIKTRFKREYAAELSALAALVRPPSRPATLITV